VLENCRNLVQLVRLRGLGQASSSNRSQATWHCRLWPLRQLCYALCSCIAAAPGSRHAEEDAMQQLMCSSCRMCIPQLCNSPNYALYITMW
jgi:hypothetical protein